MPLPDPVPPVHRRIEVVPYDPRWPVEFASLRGRLADVLGDRCIGIEHVGSTSVPGLAAKPIIDIDVVISSRLVFTGVRELLQDGGYLHRGNLGIPGRESFLAPAGTYPHHLYVCSVDTPNLGDHLVLRDMLRRRQDLRDLYEAAKRDLAARFPHDIEAYVEGKSAVIEAIMREARAESSFASFQPGAGSE